MEANRRSVLTWGVILVLAGLIILVFQLFPDLWSSIGGFTWPWLVIGVGVLLFIIGIIAHEPGMAVPACVVSGIGAILYWQNSTGNWASWAWIWALIPGFAGLGTVIMGIWQGKVDTILGGLGAIVVSIVLTIIFGSLLGGPQLLGDYAQYWPVLLIVLGLISLVRYFSRSRHRSELSTGLQDE